MSVDVAKFQASVDFNFKNEGLVFEALCHKSYNKENPQWPHNEKLEFLGDAVLDLVVSDLLMEKFTEDKEGSLSRKRASVVNEDRLDQVAREKNIDQFLLIGQREANNNLRENPRIVASAFEAVVGAIYKDSGFDSVFPWISNIFSPIIDDAFDEHDFEGDYKTRFQEWVQEEYKQTPRYKVVSQEGPDHDRTFEMEVFVGDESWGTASGSSKKAAAQNAAKVALEKVKK